MNEWENRWESKWMNGMNKKHSPCIAPTRIALWPGITMRCWTFHFSNKQQPRATYFQRSKGRAKHFRGHKYALPESSRIWIFSWVGRTEIVRMNTATKRNRSTAGVFWPLREVQKTYRLRFAFYWILLAWTPLQWWIRPVRSLRWRR